MVYCILNQVKSLREGIETFNYRRDRIYHIGFKDELSLSTVSKANSKKNNEAYKELFEVLKYDVEKMY